MWLKLSPIWNTSFSSLFWMEFELNQPENLNSNFVKNLQNSKYFFFDNDPMMATRWLTFVFLLSSFFFQLWTVVVVAYIFLKCIKVTITKCPRSKFNLMFDLVWFGAIALGVQRAFYQCWPFFARYDNTTNVFHVLKKQTWPNP